MAWNDIIGQEKVKSLLQKAVMESRIAHAYCFIGSQGYGKEAAAIEFAKTVNCEKPVIDNNLVNACGKCPSCRMASSLEHPNISLVYSLPALKSSDSVSESLSDRLSDDQISEIQEQNALKAENPYYNISIPKATQIRIASIREIKKELSFTASSEGRRVIIVCKADDMTTEAANAFLKTLEEPQNNITIIITTHKPESILPTIMSRCQQIHFQPLPENELAQYLVNHNKALESDAKLAASYSQGSYLTAIEFLDEEMKQLREDIIDFLRVSLKKRAYRIELLDKIEPLIKDNDKNKVEKALFILLIWLRDSISIIKLNSPDLIINKDQQDTLVSFSKNFANKPVEKAVRLVEEAISLNRRNVNKQLLLVNMFIKVRNILLG